MSREIFFKAKRVDNQEWVEGEIITYFKEVYIKPKNVCFNYFKEKQCMGGNEISCFEVIPSTVSQLIDNVRLFLEDKKGNIITDNDAWQNDIIEIEYQGKKYVGYLDIEYGCVAFICDTLSDGFVWVHELENNENGLVEDVDGMRYITAKLLGNRFDNSELLKVEE